MKTVPVTVVTPLSRPPLPNAATVPSRFTPSSLPTALDTVASPLPSSSEPEPYSLWYVVEEINCDKNLFELNWYTFRGSNSTFLARLFSKKMSRYCHSPVGSGILQKL